MVIDPYHRSTHIVDHHNSTEKICHGNVISIIVSQGHLQTSTQNTTIRRQCHSDISLDPEFLKGYALINRAAVMARQPDR
jgi:hypothetical protein